MTKTKKTWTSRPSDAHPEAVEQVINCYICGSSITLWDRKGCILCKCDRCKAKQAALEHDLINRPGDDELK